MRATILSTLVPHVLPTSLWMDHRIQCSVVSLSRSQRVSDSTHRPNWIHHLFFSQCRDVGASKRVQFKILLYVFKSLQHASPNYISDYFSMHVPARTTRSSSDHNRLAIPIISKTITGEKRFHIAAAMAWNSLSMDIKSATTTSQFESFISMNCFSRYFCFCVINCLYIIYICFVSAMVSFWWMAP